MAAEEFKLGRRTCFRLGAGETLLVQPVDSHELELLEEEHSMIRGGRCQLAAVLIEDWNKELSPWKAPALFGKDSFGDGAEETLRFITEELVPALAPESVLLGGYSLAGLFSLWAAYRTDLFSGVAGVSPSVWFPGWERFIAENTIRTKKVYLSLGDREERTKNSTAARVGDNIRLQHQILTSQCECVLEWNPGNHFKDPDRRTARGFRWLLGETAE